MQNVRLKVDRIERGGSTTSFKASGRKAKVGLEALPY